MTFDSRENAASRSFTPVFIGGCPRSGTTFLASILGTAPGCVVTPESTFKNSLWRASGGGRRELDAVSLAKLLDRQFRYRLWGLPPTGEFLPAGSFGFAEILQRLVAEYAALKGEDTQTHWIDHTPRNLRHGFALLRMFPDARFIHIVRDGRGVASSVMHLDWGPNTPAAAARWWVRRLGEGVVAEGYLADRASVVRVRYEDLVRSPAATLTTLSRVLFGSGETIELSEIGESMELPEYTRSQHRLIGRPPDPSRADAWREKLSPAEIEEFEFIAGGFLEHLGYETECPAPKGPSTGHRLRRNLKESWRGMANSFRRRRTRVRGGGG